MILVSVVINYLDRSNISIAASALKADLQLDSVQMGYIFLAFSLIYALLQVPGGVVVGRVNPRKLNPFILTLWSLATLVQGYLSSFDFLPYIEQNITNFGRIDVCNVGGLTESMKVAALCEAHYIDIMPHDPLGPICTVATIHLAAAIPNFAWLEVPPCDTDMSGQHRYFINHPEV